MEDRTHLLIALAGPIGAGKTAFAARLEATHGFFRVGFGDAIKEEVAQHFRGTLKAHIQKQWAPWECPAEEAGWNPVIHDLLWRHRDEFSRVLLQEFGMMRRRQEPEYWIRRWQLRTRGYPRVVNDNLRMRNEAEAVRALGGRLVKLVRPALPAPSDDPTEHGLDEWEDWDVVVKNDGTLEDLAAKADDCVALLWG